MLKIPTLQNSSHRQSMVEVEVKLMALWAAELTRADYPHNKAQPVFPESWLSK